jgi:hypothetical protein
MTTEHRWNPSRPLPAGPRCSATFVEDDVRHFCTGGRFDTPEHVCDCGFTWTTPPVTSSPPPRAQCAPPAPPGAGLCQHHQVDERGVEHWCIFSAGGSHPMCGCPCGKERWPNPDHRPPPPHKPTVDAGLIPGTADYAIAAHLMTIGDQLDRIATALEQHPAPSPPPAGVDRLEAAGLPTTYSDGTPLHPGDADAIANFADWLRRTGLRRHGPTPRATDYHYRIDADGTRHKTQGVDITDWVVSAETRPGPLWRAEYDTTPEENPTP